MEVAPPDTDARALLRSEGPRAALERLKLEVRKAPRDARLRTFLFQLFCVFAEWDRALNQLTVANELTGVDPANPLALPMAQMAEAYRAAIRCEMLRERVFSGARTPTILGQPEPWMSQLIEANRVLATAGADAAARKRAAGLRDAAFEAAPAAGGTLSLGLASPSPVATQAAPGGEAAAPGGKKIAEPRPFEWIADADQRLGPMLEAFIEGKYYWLPYTRLARLDIEAPADLRDHVWMPAHFTWANGGEAHGFIPTRYPGSAAAADEALAWSRRTEWSPAGDGDEDWFPGLGQRMLTTDADEVALMDLRRVVVTSPGPDAADATAGIAADVSDTP